MFLFGRGRSVASGATSLPSLDTVSTHNVLWLELMARLSSRGWWVGGVFHAARGVRRAACTLTDDVDINADEYEEIACNVPCD